MELEQHLQDLVLLQERTGSRVICEPAPVGTDDDYVMMTSDLVKFKTVAEAHGWSAESGIASSVPDFLSLRKGEVNLILTDQPGFYGRFVAATAVAKHLNLLKKEDRVKLFQAVLYGRIV